MKMLLDGLCMKISYEDFFYEEFLCEYCFMNIFDCHFNLKRLRASVRTFNPKQLKYEDKSDTKFKFATFNKNVNRVKAATAGFDPELAVRELK